MAGKRLLSRESRTINGDDCEEGELWGTAAPVTRERDPTAPGVMPRRLRGSVSLPGYRAPESRASIASESSRVL